MYRGRKTRLKLFSPLYDTLAFLVTLAFLASSPSGNTGKNAQVPEGDDGPIVRIPEKASFLSSGLIVIKVVCWLWPHSCIVNVQDYFFKEQKSQYLTIIRGIPPDLYKALHVPQFGDYLCFRMITEKILQ